MKIAEVCKKAVEQVTKNASKSTEQNTTPAAQDNTKTPITSDSSGNGSSAISSSAQYVEDVLKNSLFETEITDNSGQVKKNANQTQEQILAKLKAAGLKTTNIHYERGETDFAQYTAALSDELKKEIVDSFDCEADYILQQEILGLFTKSHDIKNGDFAATLKKMGYEVSRKSVKTTYLTDWKSGRNSTYRTGHLSVYTITDPKTGAEIKIADTNGNGAIEVEEVVANEFLTGIAAQIDISNFTGAAVSSSGGASAGALSGYSQTEQPGSSYNGLQKDNKQSYTEDGKLKLNERQYNLLKEKIAQYYTENKGYDDSTAALKANLYVEEKCIISSDAKAISNIEGLAISMVK